MPNYSAETIKKGDNKHTVDLYPSAEIWTQDQAQTSNSRADGNRPWWLLISFWLSMQSWGALWFISKVPAITLCYQTGTVLRCFQYFGPWQSGRSLAGPSLGRGMGSGLGCRPAWGWAQVFMARVEQGRPRELPLASLTHHTNRDIISPGGAAASDAWPDAGKGVPVIANSKERLKKKKMHHSVPANDNNTFLFILIQKQFFFFLCSPPCVFLSDENLFLS